MLVNDANGKHPVAPGVLYVIHKYVYKKYIANTKYQCSCNMIIIMYFNIGQLLVIPHPAVPVAMYLFRLNF